MKSIWATHLTRCVSFPTHKLLQMRSQLRSAVSYVACFILQAKAALSVREMPIGCVFVNPVDDAVLARGQNRTNVDYNVSFATRCLLLTAHWRVRASGKTTSRTKDFSVLFYLQPTRHAEMVAIESFVTSGGSLDALRGTDL